MRTMLQVCRKEKNCEGILCLESGNYIYFRFPFYEWMNQFQSASKRFAKNEFSHETSIRFHSNFLFTLPCSHRSTIHELNAVFRIEKREALQNPGIRVSKTFFKYQTQIATCEHFYTWVIIFFFCKYFKILWQLIENPQKV